MTHKRCSHCRVTKHIDDFYRNASKPDGHADECKGCFNEIREEYYSAVEKFKIQRLKERW